MYLQGKEAFARHPYSHAQPHRLSEYTLHAYLRPLRSFCSWCCEEGFLTESPFARVKMPRLGRKVIHPYTEDDLARLFAEIDVSTPEGFRDQTLFGVLLDTP